MSWAKLAHLVQNDNDLKNSPPNFAFATFTDIHNFKDFPKIQTLMSSSILKIFTYFLNSY